MAEPQRTRLHVSTRSIVVAVVMLALAIATLAMLSASARVIGWVLVAATFAGLLHPIVDRLATRVPRGVALAIVVVSMLAIAGLTAWRVVDDISDQLRELQRALPKAAREIERSDRFGETATEARLADRVEAFVDELPERLRGGDVDDALRSAATRGVAFLATFVLTIFFLIHGPRLLRSGLRQMPVQRRERVKAVASAAYARSWGYVIGSLGMALISGLLAYACARALDLPGAAPLALWVALIDVIPAVGIIVGAVPLVLLAAATSPAWQVVLIALVLLTWEIVETLYLQPRVERASLHIGPFLTIAVAMVGLELYGIGGALVSLVVAVCVMATADEVVGLGPGSPHQEESVASAT